MAKKQKSIAVGMMNTSREKILAKLKDVHSRPSNLHSAPANLDDDIKKKMDKITADNPDDMWRLFQHEFELVSGEFFAEASPEHLVERFSHTIKEENVGKIGIPGDPFSSRIAGMISQKIPGLEIVNAMELSIRKNVISGIPVTVATASFAIADTGTLAIFYDDVNSSLPYFLADVVLVAIEGKNILANQFEFFKNAPQEKLTNMVYITGPSRTADIEKVLVLGAHGPRRIVLGVVREL